MHQIAIAQYESKHKDNPRQQLHTQRTITKALQLKELRYMETPYRQKSEAQLASQSHSSLKSYTQTI